MGRLRRESTGGVSILQLRLERPRRRRKDAALDHLAAVEHQKAAGAVMADRAGALPQRLGVASLHHQQRDIAVTRGPHGRGAALAQAIRPDACEIAKQLPAAGTAYVVMLTGDNRVTAEAIGRELGIDEVQAKLLPEDKVKKIEELVTRYGTVAMVGDGVNDAPALARASLGIAMGDRLGCRDRGRCAIAADVGASLLVVGNALRPLSYRIP